MSWLLDATQRHMQQHLATIHEECSNRSTVQTLPGQASLKRICVPDVYNRFLSESVSHVGNLDGVETYECILWCLRNFGLERTDRQCEFHRYMLNGMLPKLFGNDWHLHRDDILKYYSMQEEANRFINIITPRQFGKTTAMAMFLAAVMYSCTIDAPLDAALFAQNQDLAFALMRKTFSFFVMLPGAKERVWSIGARDFVVIPRKAGADHTLKRKLLVRNLMRALPSGNPEGRRGISPWLLIVDEIAFANKRLLPVVIGPLAGNAGFCNYNISSPGVQAQNIQTNFETATFENGEHVYLNVAIRTMCLQCVKDGNTRCDHVQEERPAWRTERGIEIQRAIMSTQDLQRETMGMSVSMSRPVFDRDEVARMFRETNFVRMLVEEPVFFVSIDPSGGGAGEMSDTGLCSFLITREGNVVIVGSESIPCKGVTYNEETAIIRDHILALRKNPNLTHALCVIIVERNLCSMRPVTMWKTLRSIRSLGRMCMYADDPQDLQRYGVWLSPEIKEAYQLNTNSFMRQEMTHISRRFVSCVRPREQTLQMMQEQLNNYARIPAPNHQPSHRPTRASYSGKESGPDDWVVAFQQGLYYALHFWQRNDYLSRHNLLPRTFQYGLLQAPPTDDFDDEVDRRMGLLALH